MFKKIENKQKDEVEENDVDLSSEKELIEIFKLLFKINSEIGSLRHHYLNQNKI